MSTEDADDPLAGSRPALANSRTTSPSRSRIGLQPITRVGPRLRGVMVDCPYGVIEQARDERGDPGHEILERLRASQRDRAARDRGPGKWPDGDPPLIVALGDEDAGSGRRRPWPWGRSGPTVKAGSLDDMVRGAITSLLGSLKDPQPSVRVAAANALASISPRRNRPG